MITPALFLGIGGSEIAFIIFVVVIIFGADKVPEIARGFAKAIKTVRNATNDIKNEVTRSAEEHFDGDAGKEIKDELTKVRDDLEELTGSIKRNRF